LAEFWSILAERNRRSIELFSWENTPWEGRGFYKGLNILEGGALVRVGNCGAHFGDRGFLLGFFPRFFGLRPPFFLGFPITPLIFGGVSGFFLPREEGPSPNFFSPCCRHEKFLPPLGGERSTLLGGTAGEIIPSSPR